MGLNGFDAETDSCDARPELLRLSKQGTTIHGNRNADLALAA